MAAVLGGGLRRGVRYAVCRAWHATGLYGLTLGGSGAGRLAVLPVDAWPGDTEMGRQILSDTFVLLGHKVTVGGGASRWAPPGVSEDWLAALHGFGWIADLRALGGDAARHKARALIVSWIHAHGAVRGPAWSPGPLNARIANWISQADFLLPTEDPVFEEMLTRSLARQTVHLRRILGHLAGSERIAALRSLTLASLALPREGRRLDRTIAALAAEIDAQILPDGGHVERSPHILFEVLKCLIEVRAALRSRNTPPPVTLQTGIDRATPMLRFFRHGDGGLALFNDSNEEEPWLIDVVLARAESRGKPLSAAENTGFQRVSASRTLLIMDTGAPPPHGLDAHAHAGTLSIEISAGRERIITNCGAYAGANPAWRRAQRTTAAHSTMTVDDLSSSEVRNGGPLGRRPGAVAAERREANGNTWIEAAHDGYQRTCGLIHRRRIYLSASGGDLRGEDTLDGKGGHRFAVRFHLHPSVKASSVQDGSAILLRLPSGAGWRMRASGGEMSLQESVYLGARGDIRRTEQIVIAGTTTDDGAQVKWAMTRLTGS